jgi:alpha-tubulin suppressor-like RCC1 family protein
MGVGAVVPGKVIVPEGVRFAKIAAGGYRLFAFDAEGALWAWGAVDFGTDRFCWTNGLTACILPVQHR